MKIKSIEVKKLFGSKNFKLNFKDGKGIFYGENGSGKTSFLNYVYAIFSGNYNFLDTSKFESIKIKFEEKEEDFIINTDSKQWPNNLENISNQNIKNLIYNFMHYRKLYVDFLYSHRVNMDINSETVDKILNYLGDHNETNGNYNIFLTSTQEEKNIIEFHQNTRDIFPQLHSYFLQMKNIFNSITAQRLNVPSAIEAFRKNNFNLIEEEVLYFNIYRNRAEVIDKYLNSEQALFKENKKITVSPKFVDTKNLILTNLNKSKNQINAIYSTVTKKLLNNILNNNHKCCDFWEGNTPALKQMLKHLNLIENPEEINSLIKLLESNENNFIKNLLQKTLENSLNMYSKEVHPLVEKIENFEKIINSYFVNKKINFNNKINNFEIKINNNHYPLTEDKLSSGEKNIITIFTNLIFNKKKKISILIDEPELSLSIEWQKKLISDINSFDNIENLIIVTHSPYVVSTELEDILQEFPNG